MAIIVHDNQKRDLVSGKTIFDYADDLKVQVPTSCGRAGICHECVVEIKHGMEALSPRGEAESFLRDNYRLACQAWIENPDIDIQFSPLRRRPKILVETQQKPTELDPLVTRVGESVLFDGEPVDQFRGRLYGLAVDLGTTTIVVELVDLETGQSAYISSFETHSVAAVM
jgi:uncharacterized 2Fe-2S/4Fe-4S cluster protein (DUF4445 family)